MKVMHMRLLTAQSAIASMIAEHNMNCANVITFDEAPPKGNAIEVKYEVPVSEVKPRKGKRRDWEQREGRKGRRR